MSEIFELTATCAFGLEALVAQELRLLGHENLNSENGKVHFRGDWEALIQANLWLRTADRVLIQLAQFPCQDFDTLFDQVYALDWENWLPRNAFIHVNGRSQKSKLFSIRDCQALTKKAIIKALQRKYKQETFPEDGPTYKLEIALSKDLATLTLDSTGPSLHKRGYRSDAGEAPLKETLAAALVQLSRWEPSRILADPLCGSGTLGIEAALIALRRAPGLTRSFAAETWLDFDQKAWKLAREAAQSQVLELDFRILCSDTDAKVLSKARTNAENAGVANYLAFQKLPLAQFKSRKKYGIILSNPPYGERLKNDLLPLYRDLKALMKELESWSFFLLSADHDLEKALGRPASKRRKLYNGKIACQFYQFFGPLPPKKGQRNFNAETQLE